eukprot:gnl/TRDRNA2_/TRDRNA2_166125_c1_seq7.p1 gnl/TRDRNA2_/TRDRNA2_166125_c1~~gnl/TRDRNA2_/TRDRNA2_166125_c1_seq7.p1  ORF type:complete len:256 (+),score=23.78 gnl/TRDRNA2_/TRDRNA2_166125_c1_seq7:24-791(+)
MIYLHYRGVRAFSLWPSAQSKDGDLPTVVGTVSKDFIALWRINPDGCTLEQARPSLDCLPLWHASQPADGEDANALKHEDASHMWTGSNSGIVRCWDVNTSSPSKPVMDFAAKTGGGQISGMVLYPEAGCLILSHTSGMSFIDMRKGEPIRHQYTQQPVVKCAIASPQSPMLFAGVGNELMQYDTRFFKDGIDYKPKAVGQWSLRAQITAVTVTTSARPRAYEGAGFGILHHGASTVLGQLHFPVQDDRAHPPKL